MIEYNEFVAAARNIYDELILSLPEHTAKMMLSEMIEPAIEMICHARHQPKCGIGCVEEALRDVFSG